MLSATLMETSGDVEICLESAAGTRDPVASSSSVFTTVNPHEQNRNGELERAEAVCVCRQFYVCSREKEKRKGR